jgi:hypothetical protein
MIACRHLDEVRMLPLKENHEKIAIKFLSNLTKTCVLVNWHKEIVFEENIADDAEHVHEDQSQNGCEYDGAAIAGNRSNHVEQSLLAINDIEKLKTKRKS